MSDDQHAPQGPDPHLWMRRVFYYNKFDPRVIVPKRWRWMGWTLNFAHPSAIPVALLLVGVCLGIPLLIAASAGGSPAAMLTAVAVGVALLSIICAHLSAGPDDGSGKTP